MNIREKTVALIDELKATCQSAGLGNDGNEFKIITQVFLYKFLNDKFGYTLKTRTHDTKHSFRIARTGKENTQNFLKTNRKEFAV